MIHRRPDSGRVSAPPAGYTLWVELPHGLNAMALLHACVPQGVTFGPGGLFSATHRFDHCLRLSFAGAWGAEQRRALVLMGQLAKTALASSRL